MKCLANFEDQSWQGTLSSRKKKTLLTCGMYVLSHSWYKIHETAEGRRVLIQLPVQGIQSVIYRLQGKNSWQKDVVDQSCSTQYDRKQSEKSRAQREEGAGDQAQTPKAMPPLCTKKHPELYSTNPIGGFQSQSSWNTALTTTAVSLSSHQDPPGSF